MNIDKIFECKVSYKDKYVIFYLVLNKYYCEFNIWYVSLGGLGLRLVNMICLI